ncbi:hypothetical protein TL16_g09824 [Triparma laevis f. inornata]|uniref:Uncharacterized protein n=2 Tax=Triparma laevis TaxID=1534972 RepID=A0A9W7KSK7_9STRA|nr:hypothetical protein TL16_g09824 [Triparma laevis f. inornata]GMI10098.1 hypothetical protein TrLO_g2349 [Triparma laevis f. longispina]
MKNTFSIIYDFKQDYSWSNRKNKLAFSVRFLFSPILLVISIPMFLLWFLPIYVFNTILVKTQGPRNTSTEVALDLKLDSANSDWSGRVLDIVRRVNSVTYAELSKTNNEITKADNKISELKSENASLKVAVKEGFEKLEKESKELKGLILKLIDPTTMSEEDVVETENVPDKGEDEDKDEDGDTPKPPTEKKTPTLKDRLEATKKKSSETPPPQNEEVTNPLTAQSGVDMLPVPPSQKEFSITP